MESHILNMYHQPRFRSIGHKLLRSTSESLSSEGSCQQNSPEYTQEQQTNQYGEESNEGEYWQPQENQGQVWKDSNENCVTEHSSQDSSSEEEDNVQDNEGLDKSALDISNIEQLSIGSVDNCSLVEGADYDVIQVYAVHPDFDLEASSDEDEQKDFCIQGNSDESDSEEKSNVDNIEEDTEDSSDDDDNSETSDESRDGLGINLDTPVVSNVDEYFIKDTKGKNILDTKDEPVVNDVDEYFIKETKIAPTPIVAEHEQNVPSIANIDDLLIKKQSTASAFHIPKVTPVITDIFEVSQNVKDEVDQDTADDVPEEVPIAETVLDMRGNHVPRIFRNVDDIKKFLFSDITDTKCKHAQKSCSVPHSPMRSICMDIDAKTCMSFEDLNLDLTDINFDSDKDKSANSSKSDDIPRTLTDEDVNSFLITNKTPINTLRTEDDFNPQDMEIDGSIETSISNIDVPPIKLDRDNSSTPIPNVLEFCIEKSPVKKENELKLELDDFVDVESCNETVNPIFEASNVKSRFEPIKIENNNVKAKKSIKINEHKVKPCNALTNGTRLQDAGVQLNKNKMRKIMMPTPINTTVRRSPSPVRSDHDYCSSKKRYNLSLKQGQSLLKPEVLSSNNRILNSRHRSCKNKKIVYHLSSDEESDKCNSTKTKKATNLRSSDDNDVKLRKSVVKQPVQDTVPSTCRKKTSPVRNAPNDMSFVKGNDSVMVKNACKASDNPSSQSSNGSIKLTIKNKSEVIIKHCDDIKDYKKDKKIEKNKSINAVSDKSIVKTNAVKVIETIDSNKNEIVNNVDVHNISVSVKDENSKPEHFYAALFSNKQDVLMPNTFDMKTEKRPHEEEVTQFNLPEDIITKIELEQPQKKKKLNLQEYKLRRGASSNNSSATVSPESIFPDTTIPDIGKIVKSTASHTPANTTLNCAPKDLEAPKKIFDPIREASRKILMNNKKQKAEAIRKRDEDIVMSKIPKVENLELQPLISEAEMLKIVGMANDILPTPIVVEKVPPLSDYDEIVVVSIGTNTDEDVFKKIELEAENEKKKSQPSSTDLKSMINFKIKKPDHVLKHNIFDTVQKDKSAIEENKDKLNQDRYKDITATLKSVEKQVETKISSNSLFASIQDVVMKKAPEVTVSVSTNGEHKPKPKSNSVEKKNSFKAPKTVILREYDVQAEHGEDKIILHLEKQRTKPSALSIAIQTNSMPKIVKSKMATPEKVVSPKEEPLTNRKRNDSDMSMSSESSPDRTKMDSKIVKVEEKSIKPKVDKRESSTTHTKDKRSNSRDRYDFKYRRSRSTSRGQRRKRSPSRNRSRSRSRYRRYRRSDSPYRRKRRSRTRSPYRKRRSPTPRREYRQRSRSRSKHAEPKKSKSPAKKIRPSPQYENNTADKKIVSLTPPLIRKPTVSESSESSTSSSSSSSSSNSSSSEDSVKSRGSSTSFRKENMFTNNYRRSYSPEDGENNTPVEERRIVFVGKLEKDLSKASLRGLFSKFGPITEVRIHTKDDGSRYGFVTYRKSRDAWSAVEAAATFPQYDVGFGGRRAFCRQTYSDLDGLEAKYSESAFLGQAALPARRNDDMSFEQMLLDVKKKLNQRKGDKKRHDESVA